MRKKSLVLLLVMALTVMTVLSGCGSSNKGGSGESTEGAGDAAASVKVGFICLHDENSTYDLNFINGAKEACETLGISEENYIIKTNIIAVSYNRLALSFKLIKVIDNLRTEEGFCHHY